MHNRYGYQDTYTIFYVLVKLKLPIPQDRKCRIAMLR